MHFLQGEPQLTLGAVLALVFQVLPLWTAAQLGGKGQAVHLSRGLPSPSFPSDPQPLPGQVTPTPEEVNLLSPR